MNRLLLAAALCLGLAGPALAATPVQKDQLTVSGRFDLTKASAEPLKGGLSVGEVKVDSASISALKGKPDAVTAAVQQSFQASLRNFGYLAGETGAVPVSVTIQPLEVIKEKDSATAISRLAFKVTGDTPAARCVPATAEGRFKALKPESVGNSQRAAGILAVIAFAAVGYDAGQFMSGQFEAAKARDRAFNARRVVGQGEGVALSGKEADMLQFAAIHATQLAMADFIRQLGESPCAQPAPAEKTVATADSPTETAIEPVAVQTPVEPAPAPAAQSAAPAT